MKPPRREIWEDRPDEGRSRPTPQRRQKGMYRLLDGEDAGVTVAADSAATPLMRLHALEIITGRQFDAGAKFEKLAHRCRGSAWQRSCLDFEPVGHDASDGDVRAHEEWRDLRRHLGFVAFRSIDDVAYWQEPAGRVDRLRVALDWAGDFWQLERE